ncbi:hypothetical protein B0H14DRAFT_3530803 [Mycena olivaceomarginata]|nr:hypothetical protein B0H14DRAFT_3530803 [Mycena olivaceomarginata]
MGNEFDFIVVGGGTAGCVVAGRLAENPKVKVLVIEAGITNPGDVDAITTPARAFELRDSKYDWAYKTTMIDRPEYTRVEKPNTRGKVLGGSSCLNYYTWIPGSAATFDEWAAYGGDDPATYHDDQELFSPSLSYIGKDGPIPVSHSDLIPEIRPFRKALTEAWVSKGHPLTEDVHNGTMRGLWKSANSIYDGKRSSSWLYLVGKPNVTVLGKTNSKKLIIENGHAVGVVVIREDGTEESYKAKAEVIVSSGVFETPKLLLLSGIGPAATLKQFGIHQVVDSPHLGQNLLDHPILPHVFRLKDGYGLDTTSCAPAWRKTQRSRRTAGRTPGPTRAGSSSWSALPRIDDRLRGQPHFEIDFVPMFCDAFQWHIPTTAQWRLLRGLSSWTCSARCPRTGTVTLNSTNPLEQPKVNINFFEEHLDIVAMREGVRWVDDIVMNGAGMKDIIGEDYPWPMPRSSDEAMNKMILERSQTDPCGTARLGKDIEHGVVDGKLRVYGVHNLRVIDASVIPVIPDCRIQNSVYMIGEKGADIIKADHPELYA